VLDTSTRIGLRFTPLEYIKVMSRELDKAIVGCTFAQQRSMLTQLMHSQELFTNISVKEIFNGDSLSMNQEVECQFIQYHQGSSVLVFTDKFTEVPLAVVLAQRYCFRFVTVREL